MRMREPQETRADDAYVGLDRSDGAGKFSWVQLNQVVEARVRSGVMTAATARQMPPSPLR
jgi:hypothetical protein